MAIYQNTSKKRLQHMNRLSYECAFLPGERVRVIETTPEHVYVHCIDYCGNYRAYEHAYIERTVFDNSFTKVAN